MARRKLLTADQVRQLLDYDPETGVFTWKPRTPDMFEDSVYPKERVCAAWNANYALKIAGSIDGKGYYTIVIYKRIFFAHRLAWLICNGKWPEIHIDHINGIRNDNRIINLREANHTQNGANSMIPINNTSGKKGVSWHKASKMWQARICNGRKSIYLGLYDTVEAAYEAYCLASSEVHGEYGRVA